MSTEADSAHEHGLRRELRFWEAIALSIGIMAPGAAMALNGTLPASLVGRAVPLAFVFASVGIMFVSYAFIRLTGYFNHAGSVYALSGVTLGPRAGFFSGWALLGTYLAFTAASTAEVGLFGQAFFDGTGIWPNAEWLVISLVAATLIWFVAYGDVRVATRALLSMEGLTVTLIVVVVVVIFARVLAGTAPSGQSFTLSPFTLPSGVGLGTVALAAVFGLLSFAGFEGAASLGEETDNPRRDIPRAIATAVITMGIFYTIVMLAQTLGFGVDKQGTESFAGSSSPLGNLSRSYVGPIMADAINFGVMVSAFASALGTATAGSRMLFALCRDGFLSRRLGEPPPPSVLPVHLYLPHNM
jgi:amino acid transporter